LFLDRKKNFMAGSQLLAQLETVLNWARSGHESDKVYRFLFLHPDDFFTIPNNRRWPIAHQVVYNGDVFLLQRILALFSDEKINIRTLSNDKKTLLDVAEERQTVHRDMYNYVKRLFLQDDLIQAAKRNDWRSVEDIIKTNSELVNEKPPYSAYFLLHYLVQNGDINLLKDLFQRFQFDTNVFSDDRETPLDLAKRLKRNDICSVLEPTTRKSAPSQLPYPEIDPFPPIDFTNRSLVITDKGNYGLEKKFFFSTTQIELPPPEQQQQLCPTTVPVDNTEKINNQDHQTNSKPPPMTPITESSTSQLRKNLTCPLTQKIMVEPVIASDGQTYEREAILDWINVYHCSPTTGVSMNATFKDNIEVKQIIQSMRKEK
jgi:hypothetical protein